MLFPISRVQGCSSPARETCLQGCFQAESSAQGGRSWGCCCCWGSCILHIALLRGFLPVGVKVLGEQSQRAEHMALARHSARSCYLP